MHKHVSVNYIMESHEYMKSLWCLNLKSRNRSCRCDGDATKMFLAIGRRWLSRGVPYALDYFIINFQYIQIKL